MLVTKYFQVPLTSIVKIPCKSVGPKTGYQHSSIECWNSLTVWNVKGPVSGPLDFHTMDL